MYRYAYSRYGKEGAYISSILFLTEAGRKVFFPLSITLEYAVHKNVVFSNTLHNFQSGGYVGGQKRDTTIKRNVLFSNTLLFTTV